MKKILTFLTLLFLVGTVSANEKSNGIFNYLSLACYSISFSANNATDEFTYIGSPFLMIANGDYIEIEIYDKCGNLAYYEIKTSGTNSGVINKSSFTHNLCFSTTIGQEYDVSMRWYTMDCGTRYASGVIFF